jgi:hypothetical protein
MRVHDQGSEAAVAGVLVLVPNHQFKALTLREGSTLSDGSSEGCAQDGFAVLFE